MCLLIGVVQWEVIEREKMYFLEEADLKRVWVIAENGRCYCVTVLESLFADVILCNQ